MDINVTVGNVSLSDIIERDYDGGHTTLGDRVVTELISQFVGESGYDGLKDRVRAIRDEEIRAAVIPAIADAMTKPIALTNTYGEPSGRTATLHELVMAEAQRMLAKSGDPYGRDRSTAVQKMVREAVESAFKEEVAEAVKQAREAVATQLGTSIGDLVAAATRDAIRARA